MRQVVAAVDVGGTSMKGALVDADGESIGFRRQETPETARQGSLSEGIVKFAGALVEHGRNHPDGLSVPAVGLVVPGLVDESSGLGLSSMILGWENVPFVRLLREETGLLVGFGHDVRSAARAEASIGGAAQGCSNFLYLSVGTGVGSCFVMDGQHVLGSHGLGGELAHLQVEPHGPPCRCGKYGCLEMVASARAVADRYAQLMLYSDGEGEERPSAEYVASRARDGDATAISVWSRAVDALSLAVSTYIELLDPELVVVGGGLAKAGEQLLGPLREGVQHRVSERPTQAGIVGAGHGTLAGMQGAALLARDAADGVRDKEESTRGARG